MPLKRPLRRCRPSNNSPDYAFGTMPEPQTPAERTGNMMLRLNLNSTDDDRETRSRIKNAYERIAGSDDYVRNQRSLGLIQVCVITISACVTGFVNAFAHRERLGWVGASLLAILITGFVEKFYFALRHGLSTIYKSRKQRFFASLCCRVIQITMILNAGILCAWCSVGIKSGTR